MRLADLAARHGVSQFIYASSGSVYGVNPAPNITEDLPLDQSQNIIRLRWYQKEYC